MNEVFFFTPINSEVKTNRKTSKQTLKRHPWRSDFVLLYTNLTFTSCYSMSFEEGIFFFPLPLFSPETLVQGVGRKRGIKMKDHTTLQPKHN